MNMGPAMIYLGHRCAPGAGDPKTASAPPAEAVLWRLADPYRKPVRKPGNVNAEFTGVLIRAPEPYVKQLLRKPVFLSDRKTPPSASPTCRQKNSKPRLSSRSRRPSPRQRDGQAGPLPCRPKTSSAPRICSARPQPATTRCTTLVPTPTVRPIFGAEEVSAPLLFRCSPRPSNCFSNSPMRRTIVPECDRQARERSGSSACLA